MKQLLLLLCKYPYDETNKERLSSLIRQVQDWNKFAHLINAHGIIALAAYNLNESGLVKEIPAEAMEFIENGYMKSLTRNTWLTECWKEVNTILYKADIKHILLKGMALEHTLYGSKGLRQMNDNDILIRPGESVKAWNLLQKDGFKPQPLKSPLFNKIMFDFGRHLPTLYKNGYALEIHENLFNQDVTHNVDPFARAVEIHIGTTNAYVLTKELQLKYLIKHFDLHTITGECQLRLYNDIVLLDNTISINFPDLFIYDPIQHNKAEFRKTLFRSNLITIPTKHRLRFIVGDIFPSFRWMKDRYKCGWVKALFLYPLRIGKLRWLIGRSWIKDKSKKIKTNTDVNYSSGAESEETYIRIIKSILESGNSVELNATGYSMFPTLRPGDRVVVKPPPKGEFPKPGTVVVFQEGSGFSMHRLIKTTGIESDRSVFITRGDSQRDIDRPWHQANLTGIALTYKRGKKEHSINIFTPGLLRYKFNRWVLRLHLLMNRKIWTWWQE